MNRQPWICSAACGLLTIAALVNSAAAQFAVQAVSYDAGTTPTAGYTSSAAALGGPEQYTGEGVFPGVVSPFNPPYLASELTSIGEAGQLTLRLSNFVLPQAGAPEIGVFSNVGLIDANYPNGEATSPAATFGFDSALVDVSADGTNWVSLGAFDFDVPTNGYTDLTDPFSGVPGSASSDPQVPFAGSLSSFSGLKYSDAGGPDMLELLSGSAGGKWLDISATGLAQVGFVRFSVADDGNAATSLNFELDAVSISHAALGAPTVPEPATLVSVSMLLFSLAVWRRRSSIGRGRFERSPAKDK
jgi:hypothetical protein